MYAGVNLKQSFSGTGYNEDTRMLKDFGSIMFFMVQKSEIRRNSQVQQERIY